MVDRITLQEQGIGSHNTSRIYRALYLNTVGFYNNLKDLTKNSTVNQEDVITRIWKVY